MDYILWHSSQLCKSKVLKTEQQNTFDSLRTFCLDQFAFSCVLCKFPETKIWVLYTQVLAKLCMNAKILKNNQVHNQKDIQYANYFQKTIVTVFKVKAF